MTVTASATDTEAIEQVLAASRLPYPPEQRIIVGECPGYPNYAGCTYMTPDAPVYVNPTLVVGGPLWPTLLHELGHRDAYVFMDRGELNRYGTLTHRRRPIEAGDERLADAWMTCARGLMPRRDLPAREDTDWPSGNGYYPSRRTHRLVCGLLARAGKDRVHPTP